MTMQHAVDALREIAEELNSSEMPSVEELEATLRDLPRIELPASAAVAELFRTGAGLCIPHAMKLQSRLPPMLVPWIDSMIEKYRQHLYGELEHLRDESNTEHHRTGWGAVRHASEYLVAHRALKT